MILESCCGFWSLVKTVALSLWLMLKDHSHIVPCSNWMAYLNIPPLSKVFYTRTLDAP